MNTTRQGDITGFDDAEVIDRKCSKCVNANNPVVCSWIMKDIAEEKGCDFLQDSSEDITHTET